MNATYKKGSYSLVLSTSGSQPRLLADVTAFGANPSSPSRQLQSQGTGCTLKSTLVTHASANQTNQMANKKPNRITDRPLTDLTVQLQNSQCSGKSTHGCEVRHHVALSQRRKGAVSIWINTNHFTLLINRGLITLNNSSIRENPHLILQLQIIIMCIFYSEPGWYHTVAMMTLARLPVSFHANES